MGHRLQPQSFWYVTSLSSLSQVVQRGTPLPQFFTLFSWVDTLSLWLQVKISKHAFKNLKAVHPGQGYRFLHSLSCRQDRAARSWEM
jgi:hypothetical protein